MRLVRKEKFDAGLEDKFWSKVNKNTGSGCWEWTKTLDHGYGVFCCHGGWTVAHRWLWEFTYGKIEDPALVLCHKCDNRKCVNLDHLFLGTRAENNADMVSKSRHAQGSQNNVSKLTEEQVLEIYELTKSGTPRKELSEKFNISINVISSVVNGRSWKHLNLTPLRPIKMIGNFKLSDSNIKKFWYGVTKTPDCWIWSGRLDSDGRYGNIWIDGRIVKAHRVSYVLHKGPIPDNLIVRHLCHNKLCVNPDHLEAGTSQDNANDEKLAGKTQTGELSWASKLTADQVREIRLRYENGETNQRELARQYDVSYWTLNSIIKGKTWKL